MFFFSKKKIDIVVYTVPGCHLCDDVISLIGTFSSKYKLNIQVTDILSDPALIAKYQHDVPVVFANGKELFRHKIDKKGLDRLFEKLPHNTL